MITFKEAKEILYQVKHHTGIRFDQSENDLVKLLVVLGIFYDVNKEEVLEHYIYSIHELSVKQKFNWN